MANITFSIFGKEFVISSDNENEEHLNNLIKLFTEKVEQLKKASNEDDPIRQLVYLSLNFLDDNIRLRKDQIKNDMGYTINTELINKLERILQEDD